MGVRGARGAMRAGGTVRAGARRGRAPARGAAAAAGARPALPEPRGRPPRPHLHHSVGEATLRELLGALHEHHDFVLVDELVDGRLELGRHAHACRERRGSGGGAGGGAARRGSDSDSGRAARHGTTRHETTRRGAAQRSAAARRGARARPRPPPAAPAELATGRPRGYKRLTKCAGRAAAGACAWRAGAPGRARTVCMARDRCRAGGSAGASVRHAFRVWWRRAPPSTLPPPPAPPRLHPRRIEAPRAGGIGHKQSSTRPQPAHAHTPTRRSAARAPQDARPGPHGARCGGAPCSAATGAAAVRRPGMRQHRRRRRPGAAAAAAAARSARRRGRPRPPRALRRGRRGPRGGRAAERACARAAAGVAGVRGAADGPGV
jgi:hypothetical protein